MVKEDSTDKFIYSLDQCLWMASNGAIENMSCDDIGILLKGMRAIDDRIIYQLNLATPTESFRREVDPTTNCRNLFSQLSKTYEDRNRFINRCLNASTEAMRSLKAQFNNNNDYKLQKGIRMEQSKVKELQNELTIEEIIRQRSLKAFEEKCKLFYKPSLERSTIS